MKELFTQVPEEIIRPGRNAILNLPPKNPQPPNVTIVNIVVKVIGSHQISVQSQYTREMINKLSTLGFLHGVICLNVVGRVKKYQTGMTKLNPAVKVYDIVPKGHNIYALVLPNGHYIILRHLRGKWLKALAFFTVHSSYFLDIHYTNSIRIMSP